MDHKKGRGKRREVRGSNKGLRGEGRVKIAGKVKRIMIV